MHIHNADSEPLGIDDEAISRLLTISREYMAPSQTHANSTGVTVLARQLTAVFEQDPANQTLASQLQLLMGNGALLQGIFRRLFPANAYPFVKAQFGGAPQLTPREHDVLLELARGRSRAQIADSLTIKSGTVKRHIENIYAKLKVESAAEALSKATALGLADFDLVDIVLPMVDGKNLDVTNFTAMMLLDRVHGIKVMHNPMASSLASTGLALMMLASTFDHDPARFDGIAKYSKFHGVILRYDSAGHLSGSFDCDGRLRLPFSIAVAPPAARRHGFTPGNLFILNGHSNPDALNVHSILECTPQGSVIREFAGGAWLSTRLNGYDLAFTADGRLLAASGNRTDAILEITQGGNQIRRLIEIIPYGGLTTDAAGRIYVAGGRWRQNPVHVFGSRGKLERTVGSATWQIHQDPVYKGITVGADSRLFVANIRDDDIEVFDSDGNPIHIIQCDTGSNPWRLMAGESNKLFMLRGNYDDVEYRPDQCAKFITVYDSQSYREISQIAAPAHTHLMSMSPLDNGVLLAGGFTLD